MLPSSPSPSLIGEAPWIHCCLILGLPPVHVPNQGQWEGQVREAGGCPCGPEPDWASFFPSTTRDTSLSGFYIPKGRCVFVNQWQINHDQ